MARRAHIGTALPLLFVLATGAFAAPAPTATPSAPVAQATPKPGPADPTATTGTTPTARPGTGQGLGTRGGLERKRARSYALCNRAAQRRKLVGSQRRRFTLRCKLGYEQPVFKP